MKRNAAGEGDSPAALCLDYLLFLCPAPGMRAATRPLKQTKMGAMGSAPCDYTKCSDPKKSHD